MNFWNDFWPILTGSIIGAVVGATVAWAFALDLRRRQATDAHREQLDRTVADLVVRLGELTGSVSAFMFALNSPGRQPTTTPHVANQRLRASLLVATMAANTAERKPLAAVQELIESESRPEDSYPRAAELLSRWRQGELTAEDAATKLTSIGHAPTQT